MKMNIPDWIALLSFLGALLSAVYAHRSANEAKLANKIASHDHRLEILNAFREFRASFAAMSENFEQTALRRLFFATQNAELYFSSELSAELQAYSDAAYDLLIVRDRVNRNESVNRKTPPEKWDQVFDLVDALREKEKELEEHLMEDTKVWEP